MDLPVVGYYRGFTYKHPITMRKNLLNWCHLVSISKNVVFYASFNVTLVVEMKDKEFTSHKAKSALQFGTNNKMIGLSMTFKSIKQKIQFSQHSELI